MNIDKSWPLLTATNNKSTQINGGLLYDRTWVIVDHNQVPLSQKRFAKHLTNLTTSIDLTTEKARLGFEDAFFDLDLSGTGDSDSNSFSVNMNGKVVQCRDEGDNVSEWLSRCFGFELANERCRLLRIMNQSDDSEEALTSFNNKADLLLVNESSVVKLRRSMDDRKNVNSACESSLPLIDHFLCVQFRPNIIIQTLGDDNGGLDNVGDENGGILLDEEVWMSSGVEILNKKVKLELVENCTRCQMINIDQNYVRVGGEKDEDVLMRGLYCKNLLKELYRMRSSSKFGVYLSASSMSSLFHDKDEPLRDTNLVESSLRRLRTFELAVGDIGRVEINC
jgi:uncharacterized protein YcbX